MKRRNKRNPSDALRKAVWERDNGQCVVCGDFVTGGWGQVHHRKFRSRGGKHTLANLILTCDSCHRRIHVLEPTLAAISGWAVSSTDDPAAVAVYYWDGSLRVLTDESELAA